MEKKVTMNITDDFKLAARPWSWFLNYYEMKVLDECVFQKIGEIKDRIRINTVEKLIAVDTLNSSFFPNVFK